MGLGRIHLQKGSWRRGQRVSIPHIYIARAQPISDVGQMQRSNTCPYAQLVMQISRGPVPTIACRLAQIPWWASLARTHIHKLAQGERVPIPHIYIARAQLISDSGQIRQSNWYKPEHILNLQSPSLFWFIIFHLVSEREIIICSRC